MSTAYYLVLDQDIPDLDADVDGKAFASHYQALDALAQQLGLSAIDEFVSIADDELADLLGEDALADDEAFDDDEGINWRSAEDGLAFFSALAAALRSQPADAPAAGALVDLEDYIRVLEQARPHGANFYLAIDF